MAENAHTEIISWYVQKKNNHFLVSFYSSPLGSDLVNWLFENVDGFVNRNDARKYASSMLKAGYIRHTVHKLTFSEQCYYVFGDIYSQGN
jgi:hypothetical protein